MGACVSFSHSLASGAGLYRLRVFLYYLHDLLQQAPGCRRWVYPGGSRHAFYDYGVVQSAVWLDLGHSIGRNRPQRSFDHRISHTRSRLQYVRFMACAAWFYGISHPVRSFGLEYTGYYGSRLWRCAGCETGSRRAGIYNPFLRRWAGTGPLRRRSYGRCFQFTRPCISACRRCCASGSYRRIAASSS